MNSSWHKQMNRQNSQTPARNEWTDKILGRQTPDTNRWTDKTVKHLQGMNGQTECWADKLLTQTDGRTKTPTWTPGQWMDEQNTRHTRMDGETDEVGEVKLQSVELALQLKRKYCQYRQKWYFLSPGRNISICWKWDISVLLPSLSLCHFTDLILLQRK